jgi:hypothetical protein
VPVANVPRPAELEQRGAQVVNDPDVRLLLDGHFYYSGEIPIGKRLMTNALNIDSSCAALCRASTSRFLMLERRGWPEQVRP